MVKRSRLLLLIAYNMRHRDNVRANCSEFAGPSKAPEEALHAPSKLRQSSAHVCTSASQSGALQRFLPAESSRYGFFVRSLML